jgi:hypothetical protein
MVSCCHCQLASVRSNFSLNNISLTTLAIISKLPRNNSFRWSSFKVVKIVNSVQKSSCHGNWKKNFKNDSYPSIGVTLGLIFYVQRFCTTAQNFCLNFDWMIWLQKFLFQFCISILMVFTCHNYVVYFVKSSWKLVVKIVKNSFFLYYLIHCWFTRLYYYMSNPNIFNKYTD